MSKQDSNELHKIIHSDSDESQNKFKLFVAQGTDPTNP